MSNYKHYMRPAKDDRDFTFGIENMNASTIETNSDKTFFQLPTKSIRIENQKSVNWCTAFAFTTCFEHLVSLLCQDDSFQASPLFNYTQSLILDSVDLKSDPGTSIRSAVSNARLSGVPRDTTWPSVRSNISVVPNQAAYEEAFLLSKMFTYFEIIRSRQVLKYILADLNFMVMIGFAVFPSYESEAVAVSGDIPLPSNNELNAGNIGGHACVILGFDDSRQVYIVVNSYGASWGKNGYGTIPYAYFEDENLTFEAKLLFPSEEFASNYAKYKYYCNAATVQSSSSFQMIHWNFLIPVILCGIALFLLVWYIRNLNKYMGMIGSL